MSKLYIISGAGLSAESGIPTFRSGDDALWDNHSLDEVCNILTFEQNYNATTAFYDSRRNSMQSVIPNEAHEIIAKWCKEFPNEVINITTNVDTLLEDAGVLDVHHVHGRIDEVVRNWDFKTRKGSHVEKITKNLSEYTDEFVKSNVVFFNEATLHTHSGTEQLYQTMQNILQDIADDDIVIVVGASLVVVPFQHYLYGSNPSKIFINPDLSLCTDVMDSFDFVFHKTASAGLRAAERYIRLKMNKDKKI